MIGIGMPISHMSPPLNIAALLLLRSSNRNSKAKVPHAIVMDVASG